MAPLFQLRPFEASDADALADIHRRAILAVSPRFYSQAERESWAYGTDPADYARTTAGHETFTIAIAPSGGVVAFCSYSSDDETGMIAGLFTAPEAQGQGAGKALLKSAEAALSSAGALRLTVASSLCAIAFYERHGYRVTARALRKTRGGLEIGIRQMEKVL